MELQPYTVVTDEHIAELQEPKIDLMERTGDGITVRLMWQRIGNICTIFLQDNRVGSACEFVVPNDEAMTWFVHPYAHKDAVMPMYEQRRNGE